MAKKFYSSTISSVLPRHSASCQKNENRKAIIWQVPRPHLALGLVRLDGAALAEALPAGVARVRALVGVGAHVPGGGEEGGTRNVFAMPRQLLKALKGEK